MNTLGTHILLDVWGCSYTFLNDTQSILKLLVDAANAAKATVLDTAIHRYAPQGVTGVVVVSESHLSIHTWPEYGYAALDVFTCGDKAMPHDAAQFLLSKLNPTSHTLQVVERGTSLRS